MTERLIRIKHSEQVCEKVLNAINRPRKMKECWKQLGEEFDPPLAGDAVKVKYKQLLSKFRDVQMECSRSGAVSSHWRYWEIFKDTFPKKNKTVMEDIVELGDESMSIASVAERSTNTAKSDEDAIKKPASSYKN